MPQQQQQQQTTTVPRQRMKRPMQQPIQVQPQNNAAKQRRMDVLIPDRNEDADCHVIAQQKRNDGLPVIQNVQGAATQQINRNDSTIHLTDSITLSVRQPGTLRLYFSQFPDISCNRKKDSYSLLWCKTQICLAEYLIYVLALHDL